MFPVLAQGRIGKSTAREEEEMHCVSQILPRQSKSARRQRYCHRRPTRSGDASFVSLIHRLVRSFSPPRAGELVRHIHIGPFQHAEPYCRIIVAAGSKHPRAQQRTQQNEA